MSSVAAPPSSVQFVAKRRDLLLIHTPGFNTYGPHGNKVGETHNVRFPFSAGMLRLSPTDFEQGGRYSNTGLTFGEAVQWLENHRLCNDREDGFWKVEQAAPEVSGEEFQAILSAAQAGDLSALEQIRADEESGWRREKILVAVDQAIANLPKAQAPAPEVVRTEQPVKRGPGRPPKNAA